MSKSKSPVRSGALDNFISTYLGAYQGFGLVSQDYPHSHEVIGLTEDMDGNTVEVLNRAYLVGSDLATDKTTTIRIA